MNNNLNPDREEYVLYGEIYAMEVEGIDEVEVDPDQNGAALALEGHVNRNFHPDEQGLPEEVLPDFEQIVQVLELPDFELLQALDGKDLFQALDQFHYAKPILAEVLDCDYDDPNLLQALNRDFDDEGQTFL